MTSELERSVKRMCVGSRRVSRDEDESDGEVGGVKHKYNSRQRLLDDGSLCKGRKHYGCCKTSKSNGSPPAFRTPLKSDEIESVNKEICQKLEDIIVNDSQTGQSSSTSEIPQKGCLQQARDDPEVSVDELAAYFDVQVHIPKKMSFMAELMYT